MSKGYTSKNAQGVKSMLTSCNRLIINKLTSTCGRMACDSLLTTSCKLSTDLFQVDCQNLLSTSLQQVVSTSCNNSANDKFATILILTDLSQRDENDKFVATYWQFAPCNVSAILGCIID